MLKRIGILGPSASTSAKPADTALCSAPIADNTEVPDGIDAILRADATPGDWRVAGELCARHVALLGLLAEAIDSREQCAPGSSMRMLEHAGRFADALGLNTADRIALERGTLLRDIGKLRVPNEVLLKHSLLTYEEWQALQAHTILGADLAVSVPGLAFIAPISRHHHENFDGTGYPDGLEGNAIPLLARAVKIIDVFCAMTSPRLYRATVASREDAFEHLVEEREKHFDPELVDLFIGKEIADDVQLNSAARTAIVE